MIRLSIHRYSKLCATGLFLGLFAVQLQADIVSDWTAQALAGARSQNQSEADVSRSLAMMHTAIYNAVEGIAGDYNLYTHGGYSGPSGTAVAGSSMEAAAASAAFTILQDLYPSMSGTFAALYGTQLAAIGDTAARANGVGFGTVVGQDILNWRANDGAADANSPPYSPVGSVPYWSPTGPAYASAAQPGWGNVATFAVTSAGDHAGNLGASLTTYVGSTAYAADYNQVKDLGSASSSLRTTEQLNGAQFWQGNVASTTNVAIWNTLAADVVNTSSLTLQESARLHASLNVALADASIVVSKTQYDTGFWRPETAIQSGGADGNAATVEDINWTPLIASPNTPSFFGGSAALASAAGTILESYISPTSGLIIGTDTNGDGVNDVFRTYGNLDAAVDEAVSSSIFAGTDFNRSVTDGAAAGAQIATVVLNTQFAAVPEPSGALMVGMTGLCWLMRRRRVRLK
jgi:hypothetical protein